MQQHPTFSLPEPDAESAAQSGRVAAFVRDRIAAAGGAIGFAEYMHHCLYAPGLGYYAAGSHKLGRGGDFVTAPEVSPVFGAMVARQCLGVLAELDAPAILEYGAGTGKLAVDMLRELSRLDALPDGGYRILEVSPDLRERQEKLIRNELPHLADRVGWLDAPPAGFSGVIIANEVLDALPVERFVVRAGGLQQVCVAPGAGDGFVLVERPAPQRLRDAVRAIEESLGRPLPAGYASEVCLAAPDWVAGLADGLQRGMILLFDYGVGRREYYAAERSGGWLRCHFRHHAHDDPLVLPGIQDITAWVDFTAVAEAAVDGGLDVAGFVTQAQFLVGGGLDLYLQDVAELPTDAQLKLSAGIKLLTLPSEMGEHFKCLGLSRGIDSLPAAFEFADRTASLG